MKEFFAFVRSEGKDIVAEYGDALGFCFDLLTEGGLDYLPEDVADIFAALSADERDYAIASAYSLLMGEKRRQALSAYFTPPALSRAVLAASSPFLDGLTRPAVLDPACGGGSFLSPFARHLASKSIKRGASAAHACAGALQSLRGYELDPGLADLSHHLLRNMLETEFSFEHAGKLSVVRCADALRQSDNAQYDLVVGNPPYGKIGSEQVDERVTDAGLANIGGHTNLYALFLMRSLAWTKPGGGLVFVLPTSFVAGPYFSGLREEILKRAEVMRIDLHEQRENLFLGAVQDICVLSLRRRSKDLARGAAAEHTYELGVIDAAGERRKAGAARARAEGEPWTLPASTEIKAFVAPKKTGAHQAVHTLGDYGYRVRVGKVVPTRERKRLHDKREAGDLPLLWASTIRPDGSFDFDASARLENERWYSPPDPKKMQYNTTLPAVVVQRTSNRDQARRLNAAAVPKAFRKKHKRGFVAENHVIVLEALTSNPRIAPGKLAAVINAAVVNERFSTVCGSFSVSAKLLQRLALPDPADVARLPLADLEQGLRPLFAGIADVLSPSQTAGNAKDAIDEPGDLSGGGAVHEHAGLKRRAVA